MQPRWEDDERGHGIGEGARVVDGLQELEGLARAENWITEAPEAHLLLHLRRACEQAGSAFILESSETDADGAFIVRLRCRDASAGLGQIRADTFALVGQLAETSTYIRQRREPLTFEILTGTPAGEGPFATHGHLIVLRVV